MNSYERVVVRRMINKNLKYFPLTLEIVIHYSNVTLNKPTSSFCTRVRKKLRLNRKLLTFGMIKLSFRALKFVLLLWKHARFPSQREKLDWKEGEGEGDEKKEREKHFIRFEKATLTPFDHRF